MPTPDIHDYGAGICAIDSGYIRPLLAAVHLVEQDGRAALIDTASGACADTVMAALAARGLAPEAVDWIVLTHVHLDHAGGTGALMARLPCARLVVHPRGARHMADPAQLFAAVGEVYGAEQAARLYGAPLAVARPRMLEAGDGQVIELAGRALTLLHTPGHARHHLCVHDALTGHVFTGDTFGVSYREFDLAGRAMVFPTTSPSQFDPQALHGSLERILALGPEAVYVTHFGRLREVARLGADLHRLIDAHVAAARACGAGADRHARLTAALAELLAAEADRHGWHGSREVLFDWYATDLDLNAAGLLAWIDAAKAA